MTGRETEEAIVIDGIADEHHRFAVGLIGTGERRGHQLSPDSAALAIGMDPAKIKQVLDVVDQHGVYSFYLEDLDHNWWEIQSYDGFQHDDMYDFGDRFSMDEDSDLHNLKELDIQSSK